MARALHRHAHSPGFLALVADAKSRVREFGVVEFQKRVEAGEQWTLIDIREDHEWDRGHLPGAIHIGRGILERDIEKAVPDKDAPIVLQCGGGFRSALSADNLQRMGYRNVVSLDGGYRGWVSAGFPVVETHCE